MGAHDSCENVRSLVAPAGTEGPAGRNSGPELRLRSVVQCSLEWDWAIEACRSIAWEQGCVRGTRVPWKPKRRRSCSCHTRMSGGAMLQMQKRVEESKGPPVPAAGDNKHELPNCQASVSSVPSHAHTLSAWPCVAGGRGHRERALGRFHHPHLRDPSYARGGGRKWSATRG